MAAGQPRRARGTAAAGCLLAATASAPLFAAGPGASAARQPVLSSAAGAAPELAGATGPSGLTAFSVIGVAGAALATRARDQRRTSRAAEADKSEDQKAVDDLLMGNKNADDPAKPAKAEPAKEAPKAPPAEEKKEEKKEEKTEEKEDKKEEKPAPAPAAEKAPEPEPTPAAAAPAGFAWDKQLGVTEPIGFFDPAGFTEGKGEETFKEYRTAELKHGRVAMMAAAGLVTQHFVLFPGFSEDLPRGLGAPFTLEGFLGFVGVVGASYQLETAVWKQDPAKEIGDFGDPLNLNQYTTEMRNKELNNGRFAMIATLAILVAENSTGKDGIEQIFGV